MSGWDTADKYLEDETGNEFPAMNNITVRGYLPCDMVPTTSKPLSTKNDLDLSVSSLTIDRRSSFQVPSTFPQILPHDAMDNRVQWILKVHGPRGSKALTR